MPETEITEVTAEQYTECNVLLKKVYGWVFLGVLITSLVPFIVEHHFKGLIVWVNHDLVKIIGIVVFEFTVVWLLKAFVNRLPVFVFYIVFFFYSILNGIVFTLVFNLFLYTGIYVVFWLIAFMFGFAALLAVIIKFDLTGLGGFLVFAIPGLLLAAIVSVLLKSSSAGYIINFAGVLIFIYLAIEHRQRILKWVTGEELLMLGSNQPSILGALMLYLDFTVIFIFIEKYL